MALSTTPKHSSPPDDGGMSFVLADRPRLRVSVQRLAYLRSRYFQPEKLKPGEPGVLDLLREARDHRDRG